MLRSDTQRRPTLLNSCAMAATAAEARFRIEYPFTARASRIIAVDAGVAGLICAAAQGQWADSARFLAFDAPTPAGNGSVPDATLRACDGAETLLSAELAGADVVVMVASADGGDAAAVVGRACAQRRIMTVGVVLTESGEHVNDAVLALRPHAMVLVVSHANDDFLDLLTALRV